MYELFFWVVPWCLCLRRLKLYVRGWTRFHVWSLKRRGREDSFGEVSPNRRHWQFPNFTPRFGKEGLAWKGHIIIFHIRLHGIWMATDRSSMGIRSCVLVMLRYSGEGVTFLSFLFPWRVQDWKFHSGDLGFLILFGCSFAGEIELPSMTQARSLSISARSHVIVWGCWRGNLTSSYFLQASKRRWQNWRLNYRCFSYNIWDSFV